MTLNNITSRDVNRGLVPSVSHAVDNLLIDYVDSPVVRALLQLIPHLGSSVETILSSRIDTIRTERLRTFFDELACGDPPLTPELIDTEDFLHCYFRTAEAALKTRRREKIVYFARLLKTGLRSETVKDVDEYEELLSIIDELSYRELEFLLSLASAPNTGPYDRAGMLSNVIGHNLSDEEKEGFIARLERSGCVRREYRGGGAQYNGGPPKAFWLLTPTLFRIKQMIEESTGA